MELSFKVCQQNTNFKIISLRAYSEFMDQHWTHLIGKKKRHWLPMRFANFRWMGREYLTQLIAFPVGAFVDDNLVAATLVYSISSNRLSLNGLFVLPEYRGQKIIDQLIDFALGLWPKQWNSCVGLFREEMVSLFNKKGWAPAEGWRPRKVQHRNSLLPYQVILLKKERKSGNDRNFGYTSAQTTAEF